jgi:hypothetical protein
MGLLPVGLSGVIAGFLIFSAGVLAMIGSCSEVPTSIRISYYMSTLALFFAGGLGVSVYLQVSNEANAIRVTWSNLPEGERMTVEQLLGCCGLSTLTEMATSQCTSEIPCLNLLETLIKNEVMSIAIVAGVGAGIQLAAIFCGCCVYRKMRKQLKKTRQKEDKRLIEEGRQRAKKQNTRDKKMDKYRMQELSRI